MKVPVGVNHIKFYQEAKKKGIKIESKWNGVELKKWGKKGICWMVKVIGSNGKEVRWSFPFTEEGEAAAAQWYKDKMEKNSKKRGGEGKGDIEIEITE